MNNTMMIIASMIIGNASDRKQYFVNKTAFVKNSEFIASDILRFTFYVTYG